MAYSMLLAATAMMTGCPALAPGPPPLADRDGDGLPDEAELLLGTDPDNPDTDFDGASDGDEMAMGTSPLAVDSDGDGIADGQDPVVDPATRRSGSLSSGNDLEPNDSFARAVLLDNVGGDGLVLEGRIDLRRDLDVFDLGSLAAGDRITVDLQRRDATLRPAIAVFDAAERVFDTTHDPYARGGPDVPGFLKRTIRHGADVYYLAVTHPHDEVALGAYRLSVAIDRGGAVPVAREQCLFLDFDGGFPREPLLGVSLVAPFDAGAISAAYDGEDEVIKRSVIDTLTARFGGFDVVIVTSDDSEEPSLAECSRLLFGSFEASAFGASVGVDAYNVDQCDDGIVFTETFTSEVFGFVPTAERVGVAIGNVAAHEAGHLLGLRHVRDPTALMDEASPGLYLLTDQTFKAAPLSVSVFPVGVQDSPSLLFETVGDH